jgi:hypothetical protein
MSPSPVAHRLSLGAHASGDLLRALLRSKLGSAERSSRSHHLAYYRELWAAAAAEVGLPARDLGDGALEIDLGTERVRVRGTHCSIDDRTVLDRAADKVLVHELLAAHGIPMPRHLVFTLADLQPARDFVAAGPGASVVKPGRGGAVGRGVSTGLRRPEEVDRAAAAAAAIGARTVASAKTGDPGQRLTRMLRETTRTPLLVEEQIDGADYRLLYLDGVLVDAIRRSGPTVVGDGRSRMRELLETMNRDRLRAGGRQAQMLVSDDIDHRRTLAGQGLTPDSVPAAGMVVRLKTTINENAQTDNQPAVDELCPAVIAQGALAATVVGARWAGVDVLTPDPTVPLEQAGGVVLEVNTTPGLAMHDCGGTDRVGPAVVLLRMLAGQGRADGSAT